MSRYAWDSAYPMDPAQAKKWERGWAMALAHGDKAVASRLRASRLFLVAMEGHRAVFPEQVDTRGHDAKAPRAGMPLFELRQEN